MMSRDTLLVKTKSQIAIIFAYNSPWTMLYWILWIKATYYYHRYYILQMTCLILNVSEKWKYKCKIPTCFRKQMWQFVISTIHIYMYLFRPQSFLQVLEVQRLEWYYYVYYCECIVNSYTIVKYWWSIFCK